MTTRRPIPSPPWWRQALMLSAFVGAVLLVAVVIGALAWVTYWLVSNDAGPLSWALLVFVVVCVAVGWFAGVMERRGDGVDDAEQEARVRTILDRLCVLADARPPKVRVPEGLPPLSWTTQVPGRRATIVVTQALAEALDDEQLEAAVAHELAHIVNGDAWIMTTVAGPTTTLLTGLRHLWDGASGKGKQGVVLLSFWMVPPLLLSMLLARLVSRHRELLADRGAVALTGSAATLSATLLTLNGELEQRRGRDLRVAATADVFHLLPVEDPQGIKRLWATHPPLAERVAALDELERVVQRARA